MKNKMQMLVNMISRPNVLLLDEPLTSLDVVVAEEMKQLLRALKTDRVILFSTHILELALDLCDEIVILNHGELEAVDKENLDNQEFKDKILRLCARKAMIKSFRISFSLRNTCRVNGILYALKQIPLLRRLLPGTLYGSGGLKIFAAVLAVIWEILSAFLGKLIYLAAISVLCGSTERKEIRFFFSMSFSF